MLTQYSFQDTRNLKLSETAHSRISKFHIHVFALYLNNAIGVMILGIDLNR